MGRVKRRFRSSTLKDVKGGASFGQDAGAAVPSDPSELPTPPDQVPPWAGGMLRLEGLQVGSIDAGSITTGTLTTTRLNLALIIVSGATWTDNSPGAGSVAWSGATVYYAGTAYVITNNNTANTYIYWSSTSSNTTFQASNTRPTLADGEFLVATNTAGVHDLAWNATSNTGVFPAHLSFEAMASLFIYGDGVDGTVTISADTHLTRDMMYDTLTINAGKVLFPDGYRIFVKNTLTNNGTIRSNGNVGTIGAAGFGSRAGGAGLTAGTMGGSSTGGAGGSGAGGNGAAQTNSIGAIGGTGGSGTFGGGVGGVNTAINANHHGLVLLSTTAELRGGTGGGGGGGSNAGAGSAGGGGGSGGGVIVIAARTIANGSGTIETIGGVGGASNPAGTGLSGGGGGGGGGAIALVYRTITTGTISVLGGAGGAASSGGDQPGGTGSTGTQLLIQQEA